MGIRSQNNPIAAYLDVFSNTGTDAVTPAPPPILSGLTATGGVISDYTSGTDVYRAHIFTSSGAFNVTAPGDHGDTVEYLVIGGGGGGSISSNAGGGGGAGGLRTNLTGHPLAESPFPVAVSSYAVVVGGGGQGGLTSYYGGNGTLSRFGPGPITSQGGGAGGGGSGTYAGIPGGSGGGGGSYPNGGSKAGGSGNYETGTSTAAPTQGNPGGTGQHVAGTWEGGGGGGGAGGAGGNAAPGPGQASYGGAGVQVRLLDLHPLQLVLVV